MIASRPTSASRCHGEKHVKAIIGIPEFPPVNRLVPLNWVGGPTQE